MARKKKQKTRKPSPDAEEEKTAPVEPEKTGPTAPVTEPVAAVKSPDKPDKPDEPEESEAQEVPRMLERWRIFGHVVFQVLLMIVIFGQVNFLSCKRNKTWDLTQNRKFTLSETSIGTLRSLNTDVNIVMAFLGSAELFSDVKGIVQQYDQFGGNRVKSEVLDLSRSGERLASLKNEHGLQFSRSQIVVIAGDGRMKTVNAEEMVVRDPATNRVREFRGEEVITSAILEVTEQQKRKIYLVGGDRQADQVMQVATQFQRMAETQNARVETLVLEGALSIPDDAEALIFAGNTNDISERELDMVQSFWKERKGGLLIFLDPSADTPNLNSLLREHGVLPRDDRVLTVRSIPGMAARKSTDVPVGIISGVVGDGRGPDLPAKTTQMRGQTQSLDVQFEDPGIRSQNIWPSPILFANQGYWGETEYHLADVAFDEKQDNGPPVWVGAAIEVGDPGDAELKGRTSRLIVVGNPDVIDAGGATSKVSADFAMASLNWIINREQLTGISSRRPSEFTLNISPAQFSTLQTISTFLLPGLAILAGGIVWFRRRA
ncbi:MAG: hypothetical protein HKN23_11425 [Verrucomicrobiales bacterium]|nr:hypothetical protein [Verrucomicrobiales bacterium]